MKIASAIFVVPVLYIAVPAAAQQKPDDPCMDPYWYEGTKPGEVSGWGFKYNEKKSKSAACDALRNRAARDFSINYPSTFDEEKYDLAIEGLPEVVSAGEKTALEHRNAATEAARLKGEYDQLRALYDDADYGPYRSQLPAYLDGLERYPAFVERFNQAQTEGVNAYNAFRDRFRNNPYPATYDWSRGGDQNLWDYKK